VFVLVWRTHNSRTVRRCLVGGAFYNRFPADLPVWKRYALRCGARCYRFVCVDSVVFVRVCVVRTTFSRSRATHDCFRSSFAALIYRTLRLSRFAALIDDVFAARVWNALPHAFALPRVCFARVESDHRTFSRSRFTILYAIWRCRFVTCFVIVVRLHLLMIDSSRHSFCFFFV